VALLVAFLLSGVQSQTTTRFNEEVRYTIGLGEPSAPTSSDDTHLLLSLPNLVSRDKSSRETEQVQEQIVVCDDVQLLIGSILNSGNSTINEVKIFTCVMDDTDSRLVELHNFPPNFENEWKEACRLGKTSIAVSGATIDGRYSLNFQDAAANGVVHQWQFPPSSPSSARARDLAVNQVGTRSVLVFRVTINNNAISYDPIASAGDVSSAVFGTGIGDVTLASQYEACSYGKLTFEEGTIPGSSAPGVIDISVATGSMDYLNVYEAVVLTAESPTSATGLGLDLNDYSHIMYQFPTGVIFGSVTNWVAFASTVRKRKV